MNGMVWDYFILLVALVALGLAIYNTIVMKMEERQRARERRERMDREARTWEP